MTPASAIPASATWNPPLDTAAPLPREDACGVDAHAFDARSGAPLLVSEQILGGRFRFESASEALLRLVEAAYGGLPRHGLPNAAPEFRVGLRLLTRQRAAAGIEPPPVQAQTESDLPCAVIDASNYAVVAPEQRLATVVASEDMLAHPYHLRYGLIEFAVCILAARCIGLVPLHAACVGRAGRGVLLLGASGSGKSTLALHGMLQGLELLAEDAVFVQPESMLATGVANYLHVTRDALRFLDAETRRWITGAPVIRRRSGVEKFEADLRLGPGRPAAGPLELVGAVFVSGEPADDPEVLLNPIDADSAVEQLSADQSYAVTQPGWRHFRHRLTQLGVHELRRGRHPRAAVDALRRLLG